MRSSIKQLFARTTATLAVCAATATVAFAGPVPYPTVGTPNPVIYTFTAMASGSVIGYFAGSGAALTEQVGLLINGTLSSAGYGLDNHSSSIGQSFNFGTVNAGDVLVFVDNITSNQGGSVYSNPLMNLAYDGVAANHNHVYSTSAVANQAYAGSLAGTYIGFEDQQFPNSDYNYFDDTFVFTNVATRTNVPEPETLGLLAIGLIGLVGVRRRKTA